VSAGNLLRQTNVHHVARFAALDQAQGAVLDEPAERGAHGIVGKAKIPCQPNNGKMKARLAFQTAVPEEVVIHGAVGGGETQTRGESVLELFAGEFGVCLFGFHDEIREEVGSQQLSVDSSQQKKERRLKHREHRGRSTESTEGRS
jgi:hypothetical protein